MAENKKLVIIKTNTVIPELGGIQGPVLSPFYLPEDKLLRLLAAHRGVYEVNPDNRNEMVRLTIKNLRTKNFAPAPQTVKVITKKDSKKEDPKEVPSISLETPKDDFTKA